MQVPAGQAISGTVTGRGRRLPGIHVFACGALDGVLPGTGMPNCGTATTGRRRDATRWQCSRARTPW